MGYSIHRTVVHAWISLVWLDLIDGFEFDVHCTLFARKLHGHCTLDGTLVAWQHAMRVCSPTWRARTASDVPIEYLRKRATVRTRRENIFSLSSGYRRALSRKRQQCGDDRINSSCQSPSSDQER